MAHADESMMALSCCGNCSQPVARQVLAGKSW
jgi:hypothetical protein